MSNNVNSKRGGYRENSGRRNPAGKTTPVRIPIIYQDAVSQFVAFLNSTKEQKSKEIKLENKDGEKITIQVNCLLK